MARKTNCGQVVAMGILFNYYYFENLKKNCFYPIQIEFIFNFEMNLKFLLIIIRNLI